MKFFINPRIALIAAHDLVMAGIAYHGANALAHWNDGRNWFDNLQPQGFVITLALAAVIFWRQGLYRGIWHYASLRDLFAILRAASLLVLLLMPLLFLWTRLEGFPRSMPLLQWFLTIALLAAPRLLFRAWKDGSLALAFARPPQGRVPVLIVGSGAAAETFIREMARRTDAPYRPVGIIEDKESRIGRDIHGVRVRGRLADLDDVVALLARGNEKPQRLILADESIRGERLRSLLAECERLGLSLARLPKLTDFKPGESPRSLDVRPVDVEDLLGRPQRILNRAAMAAMVRGRRVLVTGAGGSIGSELSRQVAALGPAELILLDASEYNLYRIDLEIGEALPDLARQAILGDVRDRSRLEGVFARHTPDLVLHAAAYKHVPLAEANIGETALTNILGTRHLAELSVNYGVGRMVMVSTDKAVNPSSVMGATKRIAEMVAQALSVAQNSTRFITVRFGNVLGSTGSVVPLFERQLSRGGPLTVTHPDMTRYFMTAREAAELILMAAAMPDDAMSQAGKICVLDMGEPVKIVDLARQMIALAGLRPDKDVPIAFTGLRAGEKLYEELLHPSERLEPSGQDGILIAAPRLMARESLMRAIDAIEAAARMQDEDRLRAIIAQLVPEFTGFVSTP